MSGGLFNSEGICERRVSTSIKSVQISVQPWATNWAQTTTSFILYVYDDLMRKGRCKISLAGEDSLMKKTLVAYKKNRLIWSKIEQEDQERMHVD